MVTITSLVPKNARRSPGINPMKPPAIAATRTVKGIIRMRGISGKDRANHTATIQPAKACPGKPTLKNPARLATANPRAINISGPIERKISPTFFMEPKAVLKSSS